jgi:sigma-54 dependent transcriptional regulator, acetoin dehydrogenase operon transcriptional activator AcoR
MAQQRSNRAQGGEPGGDKSVMLAWERFLSGDGMPSNAVRRMVEDSWRRCLDHGVNPVRNAAPLAVDGDGLYGLRHRHADLIEAARPVMAQAREFLAESGTMMVLTDPQGVILSVEGDPATKDNGQSIHLIPGAVWTEGVSGTNAIGTALASDNPVQICAAEHFCEGVKQWTCSATVIRDPYDGEVLGVLDISGLSGSHNTHCLALAVAGAGRIENRLVALEMEKRARLLDATLTHSKRWGDSGLVIFDRRGRMVRANENAGLFLHNKGLDIGVCNDLRIAPEGAKAARGPLPEWILPDWIEPVIDHEERLGTVLALPLSRHWGKAALAPEEVESAKGEGAFARIVGNGAGLTQAKARAQQLAKLPVPVLLLGPTGAGKEIFARALHDAGPNAAGPFVPLNCGSMTRDLLASELFGYAEGAFTGARRGGMVGKFEAANGGTLFLDEIGEMHLDLQAHFLRVLEEGEVYRLGETKPRKVKVRILAATNRDLRTEVAAGKFRVDMYYRLAVTILHLPALAEHREDIPTLVRHFTRQAASRFNVPIKPPSTEVMAALMAYDWPGNVRELRNVVEGMVLLASGDTITDRDLPPEISPVEPTRVALPPPPQFTAVPVMARQPTDRQRDSILAAIAAENGNFTRAAIRLGIAKSTLYERMKRCGIKRDSIEGES